MSGKRTWYVFRTVFRTGPLISPEPLVAVHTRTSRPISTQIPSASKQLGFDAAEVVL